MIKKRKQGNRKRKRSYPTEEKKDIRLGSRLEAIKQLLRIHVIADLVPLILQYKSLPETLIRKMRISSHSRSHRCKDQKEYGVWKLLPNMQFIFVCWQCLCIKIYDLAHQLPVGASHVLTKQKLKVRKKPISISPTCLLYIPVSNQLLLIADCEIYLVDVQTFDLKLLALWEGDPYFYTAFTIHDHLYLYGMNFSITYIVNESGDLSLLCKYPENVDVDFSRFDPYRNLLYNITNASTEIHKIELGEKPPREIKYERNETVHFDPSLLDLSSWITSDLLITKDVVFLLRTPVLDGTLTYNVEERAVLFCFDPSTGECLQTLFLPPKMAAERIWRTTLGQLLVLDENGSMLIFE